VELNYDHNLVTGQAVMLQLDPNAGNATSPIGGLTAIAYSAEPQVYSVAHDNIYYVKVSSKGKLKFAESLEKLAQKDFITLTNPESGSAFRLMSTWNFASGGREIVDTQQDTINFASPHGFTDGSQVRYELDAGDNAIGGLTSGDTYYVKRISNTAIQLTSTNGGSALNLTSDGSGNHRFVKTGSVFSAENNITVDTYSDEIILPTATNFEIGEAVKYNSNGTQEIGGLSSGNTYYIVSNRGNSLQLSATADGTVIDLTSACGIGNHSFVKTGIDFAANNDIAQKRRAEALELQARLSKDLGISVNLTAGDIDSTNDPDATTDTINNGRQVSFRDITVKYDEQQLETSKLLAGITNAYAFTGTGYNTPEEIGIRIDDTDIGLALYKTIDHSQNAPQAQMTYALTGDGSAALVGVDDVTLNGNLEVKVNRTGEEVNETITTPGGEIQLDFAAADILTVAGSAELDIKGIAAVSGNFGIEKTDSKLIIGATEVNAFVGSGYQTSDELGVKLTDGQLGMVLNTVKENDTAPTQYAVEIDGKASLEGIPALTLEGEMKARINRMGEAVNESVTLSNGEVLPISFTSEEANLTTVSGSANLKAADILDASGNFAVNIGEPDSNNRRAIDITATDVSTFVGIGLDTPEKKDDIGASLSNAEFILNLDENDNYTYKIDNAEVALTGIDLFEFSGVASASGDKDNVSLELDDITISISDYVRLKGNFDFDISSDSGTQVINLNAIDASAFIGLGAGKTDENDYVGVEISNVNGAVKLLKDENDKESFAYGLSGDVAL
ncbi:MAG: hypothetical protein AAGM40_28340, partial [Cyanobacteria bacterium J06573_2]